jgi:hypothetical protein
MSKISTVYDQVLTELGTLFSGKTRIPNAYSLVDNNFQFLRDGWGLKIGTSSPAESEFKSFNRSHTFSVVLSREVIRTDSDADPIDVVTKAILEDVYTLERRFMDYDQLSIEADIEIIEQGNNSGIEFFIGDDFSFASIEADFNINIRENI